MKRLIVAKCPQLFEFKKRRRVTICRSVILEQDSENCIECQTWRKINLRPFSLEFLFCDSQERRIKVAALFRLYRYRLVAILSVRIQSYSFVGDSIGGHLLNRSLLWRSSSQQAAIHVQSESTAPNLPLQPHSTAQRQQLQVVLIQDVRSTCVL